MAYLRTFVLLRDEDVSGVSGTGLVATGAVLPSGRVVLEWRPPHRAISLFENVETLLAIHGHGGRTRVLWSGDEEED